MYVRFDLKKKSPKANQKAGMNVFKNIPASFET